MSWFIVWAALALLTAGIAHGKGRSGAGWFVYGFLIWPIALVHALLLDGPGISAAPRALPASTERTSGDTSPAAALKTCPRCAEEVKAAAHVCRFCGHTFAETETPAASVAPRLAPRAGGDLAAINAERTTTPITAVDVLIRYHDAAGDASERIVTVHAVENPGADTVERHMMFIGYCHLRKHVREFRIDRVDMAAEAATGEVIRDLRSFLLQRMNIGPAPRAASSPAAPAQRTTPGAAAAWPALRPLPDDPALVVREGRRFGWRSELLICVVGLAAAMLLLDAIGAVSIRSLTGQSPPGIAGLRAPPVPPSMVDDGFWLGLAAGCMIDPAIADRMVANGHLFAGEQDPQGTSGLRETFDAGVLAGVRHFDGAACHYAQERARPFLPAIIAQ